MYTHTYNNFNLLTVSILHHAFLYCTLENTDTDAPILVGRYVLRVPTLRYLQIQAFSLLLRPMSPLMTGSVAPRYRNAVPHLVTLRSPQSPDFHTSACVTARPRPRLRRHSSTLFVRTEKFTRLDAFVLGSTQPFSFLFLSSPVTRLVSSSISK